MKSEKAPKKASRTDWHPADVQAALKKKGWSFSQLSLHHGYANKNSLHNVTRRQWPKAELIVAEVLGLQPQQIWPSRYDEHGQPKPAGRRRGPLRPDNAAPPSIVARRLPPRRRSPEASADTSIADASMSGNTQSEAA